MRAFKLLAVIILLTFPALAQNASVIDEKSGKTILIGSCTCTAFADTNYAWWYNSGYEMYQVDTVIVQNIAPLLDSIQITVVMGTWCSDSRNEVPRFIKIADYLKVSNNFYSILAVDRKKHGIGAETESLNIELVPTFIVYRSGIEIGRIVETPKESIEKDLLQILAKQ
ncbi:MAG: thioredoxin family protein [Ignavibacteriales bacterium]|nr:thioredoxin family protein [Ignavibacteriales bacterium]